VDGELEGHTDAGHQPGRETRGAVRAEQVPGGQRGDAELRALPDVTIEDGQEEGAILARLPCRQEEREEPGAAVEVGLQQPRWHAGLQPDEGVEGGTMHERPRLPAPLGTGTKDVEEQRDGLLHVVATRDVRPPGDLARIVRSETRENGGDVSGRGLLASEGGARQEEEGDPGGEGLHGRLRGLFNRERSRRIPVRTNRRARDESMRRPPRMPFRARRSTMIPMRASRALTRRSP
jgi:hypothetical protein